MYILELNQWERYEYDNTIAIAVSEDINKLKELASHNNLVFDEQWAEKPDSVLNLTFDIDYNEKEIYSCQTYVIRPIKCV